MTNSPYDRGRPRRSTPPNTGGEYRIRDGATGELRYIGETNDLSRRQDEHTRSGLLQPGDTFEWKASRDGATSLERRAAEREHIAKHSPPANRRAGGGGRPPKQS